MKPILLCLSLFALSVAMIAQSSPQVRLSSAYSTEERSHMSTQQQQELMLRAEKLCWFEGVKPGIEQTPFQILNRNGEQVVLTEAEVSDFNPLMYQLPQEANRCQNLVIQTQEGTRHLLIVRSTEMMIKEQQRQQVKIAKTSGK
jgi:hypothetical protein